MGSYGYTRFESDGRTPKHHDGIDWLAPMGAPVYASHDGFVSRAGEQTGGAGYGQRIYIRSKDGATETIYAHLAGQLVRFGASVRAGDLIGWIGRTGNVGLKSEIPTHLHFEVRIGHAPGKHTVDPIGWLKG